MEEESWRRNHGEGIMEESRRRNQAGGIMEESGWRNHGGGTMASRRHLRDIWLHLGGIWEASGSFKETPRSLPEAPRRHPGGTQEGSGRHLGDLGLRGDFCPTCLNNLIDVCSRFAFFEETKITFLLGF